MPDIRSFFGPKGGAPPKPAPKPAENKRSSKSGIMYIAVQLLTRVQRGERSLRIVTMKSQSSMLPKCEALEVIGYKLIAFYRQKKPEPKSSSKKKSS